MASVANMGSGLDDPPRLCLLGAPLIEHGGAAHLLPPERPMQMLAWLAAQTDWTSRERLAALFWPDHPPEAARRNVRKLLHRAHATQAVRGLSALQEQAGSVRWPLATDVHDFEQAAAAGDVAGALALWRGEPWQGFDVGSRAFGEWVQFERQRLRARWRDLLLTASAGAADTALASRWARMLLEHDPLDEAAVQILLRCERDAGRSVSAQAALSGFEAELAASLGLAPGRRTRALLHAPPRDEGPATMHADEAPFLGRAAETQEIAAMLASGSRWISVVGPGGVGKSRLVRHAGPRWAAARGTELRIVAFDEHSDAAAALSALLAMLGITPKAAESPPAALQRALASRALLLVLDNLEHLPGLARTLGEALAPCAVVQVIATTRMRLGVAGEWLLPLHGLPWPAADDADRAEAFDAVRFFVRCAKTQDPAFGFEAQRAGVVALTSAVEGLPLALELAALTVRALPVAEVAADVSRGDVDLLDAGAAAPHRRRRSVRAVFEHSWRLLVPAERALLARLTVFAGSFTREAARDICEAPLPALVSLIDKSLVRVDENQLPATGTGTSTSTSTSTGTTRNSDAAATRLSLHPLVQQLAAEQLDAAQHAALRARHARHFMQVLVRYPRGRMAEQAAFFDRVEADLANLRAAWLHMVDEGEAAALAAGQVALASYFHSRARCDEGLLLIDAARPLLRADARAHAESQVAGALLQYSRSRYPETAALARAGLGFARQRKDTRLRRASLFMLGQAAYAMGHYDSAAHCYRESLELARQEGNGHGIAGGLALLGALAAVDGRYGEAVTQAEQSIEQQARNGFLQSETTAGLAFALHRAGRTTEADSQLLLARERLPRHAGGTERSNLAYTEAVIAFERGELARAQTLAEQARDGVADGGEPAIEAAVPLLLGRIALQAGDRPAALAQIQRSLAAAQALHMQWLVLAALVAGGEWLLANGEIAQGVAALQATLQARGLRHEDRVAATAALAALGAASGLPTPAAQARAPNAETTLADGVADAAARLLLHP
jgi:predicted ATPase/DNA-binding SARP family transcriptional activator/tetratricopeptide (TPR) repeat protein